MDHLERQNLFGVRYSWARSLVAARRFVTCRQHATQIAGTRRTILRHRSPPATGYYRCGAWHRAEPRPTKRPSATVTGDREAVALSSR